MAAGHRSSALRASCGGVGFGDRRRQANGFEGKQFYMALNFASLLEAVSYVLPVRAHTGGRYMKAYQHSGLRPDDGRAPQEIERLFWENTGRVVDKWHHYLPIYDRYFASFAGRRVRMLEIGVFKGGSLALWRKYFGPEAVIFGIDINPDCAAFDGESGSIRIGSQADPEFLRKVVAEMGGLDIVLDDGSHFARHIRASLDALFPLLSDGGIYMVEDLQTAYWRYFSGSTLLRPNFMRVVKKMMDDINHWYHPHGQRIAATADRLTAIHVHNAVVVLEKGVPMPPRHSRVGTE
jgi:hypothetical protein